MIGKTIDELTVGDNSQFSKTVTETDAYSVSVQFGQK
jgi:hypothetical protein